MAFTYDQLKTAIQDYTQNTETSFVTNLPVFIRSAEERILKTVQLTLFRKNSTGNMTASDEYLIQPTDFLAPFSLSFTDANNDKKITNGELHSYVRSNVTRQAVRLGREQTPQLQGDENRVLVEFN